LVIAGKRATFSFSFLVDMEKRYLASNPCATERFVKWAGHGAAQWRRLALQGTKRAVDMDVLLKNQEGKPYRGRQVHY
jgi:hypothetical protein